MKTATRLLCLLSIVVVGCDSRQAIVTEQLSDAGISRDGSSLCPAFSKAGTPCSVEGLTCGSCPEDPCQICSVTRCESGSWVRMEDVPDPSCTKLDDQPQDGGALRDTPETCPSDYFNAIGKPCAAEGQYCGECADAGPCSFCNLIYCQSGRWQRAEVYPDPACYQDGGLDPCPLLPSCNWCGGADRYDEATGCVVGWTCANGADPCVDMPCSPGDPNSCKAGEYCDEQGLCWPYAKVDAGP